MCERQTRSYIVDRLIPERSVSIAIGDCGLGKSPWAYQLGLCVAAGIPFLGLPVKQGRVLHIDLENGIKGIRKLCHRLCRHLGLKDPPPNFRILPSRSPSLSTLENLVKEEEPSLVTIDPLWSFHVDAVIGAKAAADFLESLHTLVRKYETAFVVIHQTQNSVPPLEDTPIISWCLQGCGPSALVDQTDVRIGLDAPAVLQRRLNASKPGEQLGDEVALVIKGFSPLLGEFGPVYLGRVFDEDNGEVLGYERLETGYENEPTDPS